MDTLWGLFVLVSTLFSQGVATGLGGLQLGFNVGCQFTDNLCDDSIGERCFDDEVFGRCLPPSLDFEGSDIFLHKFKLSSEDFGGLQWTLRHLDNLGYTWTDFYTQCVVQVILEGFRIGQTLDLDVCNQYEDEEINLELLKFLEDEENNNEKLDGKETLNHNNGEEFHPDSSKVYANEVYYPPLGIVPEMDMEREIKSLPSLDKSGFEFIRDGIENQREAEGFQNYMLSPDHPIKPKMKRSSLKSLNGYDKEEDDAYDLSPAIPMRYPVSQLSSGDIKLLEDLAIRKNEDYSEETEEEDSNIEEYMEDPDEEILEAPSDDLFKNHVFLRKERLDVKKPGPHYRVNNFAFDGLNEYTDKDISRLYPSRQERTLFGSHRIHPKIYRRIHPILREENSDWLTEEDEDFEPNRGLYWPRWNYNEMNPDAGLDDAARIEEVLERMAHDRNVFPNEIPGIGQGQGEDLEDGPEDQITTLNPDSQSEPLLLEESKKLSSFSRLAALQGLNVHEARRSELDRLGLTTIIPLTTEDDSLNRYNVVDTDYVFIVVKDRFKTWKQGAVVVKLLADLLEVPHATFADVRVDDSQVTFRVLPNRSDLNATHVANKADELKDKIKEVIGATITKSGIGDTAQVTSLSYTSADRQLLIWSVALCAIVAAALTAAGVLYLIRRGSSARKKLAAMGKADAEASQDYKDLCRARMTKPGTKASSHPAFHGKDGEATPLIKQHRDSESNRSSRSSTSSWCEEPITSNIHISTGHMVLAYMEDHLRNRDRLEQEWEGLCTYEPDPNSTIVASKPENAPKNRVPDVLPYDHNRVILSELANASGSDYINASTITDHDPRNPAYIATQGPLPMTVTDFWQLVWEQGSVVLVLLTRLSEHGEQLCYRYWPEEGSQTFHIYEVHLVSEHIWCDDYLVRSFYLKNLRTGETRTVTQFHFLSWTEGGIPISAKSLLEFRRKVNKSYRGRSCPIIVHCSDGAGRAGTYCLIDMVLNRISKGAKEIDIAATLEHLRDQRIGMVRTRQQFEFVLKAVAEEVHAILRALPQ
ncbi:uncharacterized protein LOC136026953 [Artemia franciscana]|uniref:Receptor-type tyrosine-protein phosphatase N2 n=1 Tax=Artemia franciscana TaxID=6661 RepID=A0AA88HI39_ARTSF|nr:hypothetical protein QYM36_013332 [Artemia franciscana]